MVHLYYSTGCRNCLQSTGLRNYYVILDEELQEYKQKTEFEVARQIGQWRAEDNHVCDFCLSPNVEISNVVVQDFEEEYKLYDPICLDMKRQTENSEAWQFTIEKIEKNLVTSEGERTNGDSLFIKACLKVLLKFLYDLPAENFIDHTRGLFFVCFTGKHTGVENNSDPIVEGYSVRLQTLIFHGLTKGEIIDTIKDKVKLY
jgi:hypothetical protein